MEAMGLLLTRHSASQLGAPPPSKEAVDAILEAAAVPRITAGSSPGG